MSRRPGNTQRDELHDAVCAISDPMVVMGRVVDQSLRLIPAADGAVVELAHEGRLVYVCAAGTLAEHRGTRLGVDGSLSGLSVRTGETLHRQDAGSDSRVDGTACQAVGAVSMVCVPLLHQGTVIGVLKVTAGRARAFGDGDVAKLAKLADFVTTVIAATSNISRLAAELFQAGDPDRAESAAINQPSRVADEEISTFVANVLRPGVAAQVASRQRIERVLTDSSFTIVCQPIVDLETGQLVGAEALARFPQPPYQPPDVWFAQAALTGLGEQLQLAAIAKAVKLVDALPGPAFLSINVGPETVAAQRLAQLLHMAGPHRVVLELTEHLRVDDYPHLRRGLSSLRDAGARLAIDDAGAGFASLAHIVNLGPDLIKLDRQLMQGIDVDPVRRAISRALLTFAEEIGANVIAEGVETAGELATARELGIPYAQGYFLGRPGPLRSMPTDFTHLIGPPYGRGRLWSPMLGAGHQLRT
jgi:EAL domain-containing protein (putative c-di-GMP-specific phosphodiesterase class I)